MTRKLTCISFMLMAFAYYSTANAVSVAITEFMNNPDGEDDGREWVELYNFTGSPVDLTGYTLADEDSDSYTFGSVSIGANDFIILVNSNGLTATSPDLAAKAIFEAEWLGGVADARVIGASFGALSNSSDELILTDASASMSWSLAYGNDEDEDSTALLQPDFMTTVFGDKAAPGIVRVGDDNATVGFLGYEDAGELNITSSFLNDAAAINNLLGGTATETFLTSLGVPVDFYDNVDADTSEADPFALTVPEPGSITTIFCWVFALALILGRNLKSSE